MIEGQEDVTWPDWVALADACEASGLAALFRSDHYLSGDGLNGRGSHDAWTTLAALAARTSRIRLGTMVSPVTFRHPSLVANAAITVDHISGGRVELGLGAGWYELEHQVYGFPFPPMAERMAMLEEQLEIVTRQWSEQRVLVRRQPLPARALPDALQAAAVAAAADRGRRRQARARSSWRPASRTSTTSSRAIPTSAGRCTGGSPRPARGWAASRFASR